MQQNWLDKQNCETTRKVVNFLKFEKVKFGESTSISIQFNFIVIAESTTKFAVHPG